MQNIKGQVMNIQNFSVNDGDGIRTTIFLAGCPLRCQWCANPEGQNPENPMVREMTASEVREKILSQLPFYRFSGGGVTFSGGEATVQQEFLRQMVNDLYDDGISLALETCGAFPWEEVTDILEKLDLIFVDIKHQNPKAHRFFTGGELEPILENIRRMQALPGRLVVRIPVIEGVNASEVNIRATLQFLKTQLPGVPLEFLPYHTYGLGKYEELGMKKPSEKFGTPTQEKLERLKALAAEYDVPLQSFL